jgi:hypothetical protein
MSEHEQPESTGYSFDNGKYTVINDNGILTALRYNEPWRSLAGDNLVAAMLDEVHRLYDALLLMHKTATDQEAELQRLKASQQSVQYHPCTSILIQGLNELKGGSAVLQRWDEARLLADAKLTK